MKLILPILMLLAAGCSSRKPARVMLHPHPEPVGVRFPEVLQTYQVGRQVDASGRLHEAHPFHRIEADAHWDLRAGTSSRQVMTLQQPAAYNPAPANDAIIAELRHQQGYTQRVIDEAAHLAQASQQLQPVISDMARVAREHATLGASLRSIEERLARLEQDRSASPLAP